MGCRGRLGRVGPPCATRPGSSALGPGVAGARGGGAAAGGGGGSVVGVGAAACPMIGDHLADETVTVAARQAAEISRRLQSWRRNDGLGLWHPTHRRGPVFEYPHRQCHTATADPIPFYIDADVR